MPYHYRVTGNITTITTYAFDKDEYYEKADCLIDHAYPSIGKIPAYSLKEVEKTIPPNYLLNRIPTGYQLMVDNIFRLAGQTAERLPDVFAMMLLEGIKKKVILIERTNEAILATA